jgi:hypothetical protein
MSSLGFLFSEGEGLSGIIGGDGIVFSSLIFLILHFFVDD